MLRSGALTLQLSCQRMDEAERYTPKQVGEGWKAVDEYRIVTKHAGDE